MSRHRTAKNRTSGDILPGTPSGDTKPNGCICPTAQREWLDDGTCRGCGCRVTERQLQEEIRLALGSVPGLVLWRNNVGEAMVDYGRGNIRPLVYGLAPGSADLIGCYRGRFVALEVKTPDGRQSIEQRKFQRCVERNGGVYLMPMSIKQAVRMIGEVYAEVDTQGAS